MMKLTVAGSDLIAGDADVDMITPLLKLCYLHKPGLDHCVLSGCLNVLLRHFWPKMSGTGAMQVRWFVIRSLEKADNMARISCNLSRLCNYPCPWPLRLARRQTMRLQPSSFQRQTPLSHLNNSSCISASTRLLSQSPSSHQSNPANTNASHSGRLPMMTR